MRTSMALALLLAAAPAFAMGRRPPKEPAMTSQWTGQNAAEKTPSVAVIKTASEWDALWKRIGKPAPSELGKHAAVAVFAGPKPTGGWTIEFLSAVSDGKAVIVRYKVHAPTGFVTQAFTAPYAVQFVETGDLPVQVAEVKE